jgi:hypothetical protein
MSDPELTSALAAADQQYTHARSALKDQAVAKARQLLTGHGETEAWALLTVDLAGQLDLTSQRQSFAAEMLAAAAIEIAKETS